MNILHNPSRRLFLRRSAALSAVVGSAAPFALNLAALGSAAAIIVYHAMRQIARARGTSQEAASPASAPAGAELNPGELHREG